MKFYPYFIDGELYWRVKDLVDSEGIEVEYLEDGSICVSPTIDDWVEWENGL